MHALETYLSELRAIRATGAGVPETSYYAPLQNLLNEIGHALSPKVRCVMTLKNLGAGNPDGGLFAAYQFSDKHEAEPVQGQAPARGAIEIKAVDDDSWVTAKGKQVTKYWKKYRQVLVTNYRDFVLVGQDDAGEAVTLETCRLANDEGAFWEKAAHPHKAAQAEGDSFVDFLKRVMLHAAPLVEPQTLAWFLASYAREGRLRIERFKDLPGLAALREGLEEALGLKFEGENGEHFFRSTLVQTLFYGVFSSWVLWAREQKPGKAEAFDWRKASWSLHVPMIAGLFEQIATPNKLKSLGLDEILDWAGTVLNRVSRPEFFQHFEEELAVQYFYEPFLEAYDPELRKALGVRYTPPEIVKYQVARVDTVLREELGVADGLADSSVVVLDPCCGTAAYIVEVLRKIHETLAEKGSGALAAQKLKKAAMERVFGFEILPAPFVVSHMQIGLLLRKFGASLSGEGAERAGVFLTNALTGWEPPKGPKKTITQPFPELQEEREAAARVKRDVPILVILGNPPYNAFAGTSPEEEMSLVEPYKEGLVTKWGVRKFNLDDLYVRFFRIAERRIAQTGRGIVSFISNFSYLSGPSFVVMRQGLLREFGKLWFDCMNGDSRETGKLTPEGKPDPSVFSTAQNKEGIRVGTAIGLFVRKGSSDGKPVVRFRHFWGTAKRRELLDSLKVKNFDKKYKRVEPSEGNRYSFRPEDVAACYKTWPKLVDLSAIPPFNGPVERRSNSLVVFDHERSRLEHVKTYLDPKISDEAVRLIEPAYMTSSGEYESTKARVALKGAVRYDPGKIVRYPFKPFDIRLAYLDAAIQPLFSRPSPHLLHQRFPGNLFLISRDTADKSPEGPPFYLSPSVCDYDFISGHARFFPIRLKNNDRLEKKHHESLFDILEGEQQRDDDAPIANLSKPAREWLASLSFKNPDENAQTAGLLWMHALAIGYSPAYLKENADGIRQDWPRVPLPDSRKALEASASLGQEVAALLDTEKPVPGVTAGKIRPELKSLGPIHRQGGGSVDPDAGDLDLTAGWGHAGKGGVTMPAKGRIVERPYTPDERDMIAAGAKALGLSAAQALDRLGPDTRDIYLNGNAYWTNVPARVWDYTIGGYQVVKKWLSYREKPLLGRALTVEEAEYVTEMSRRIAAILLLEPRLDENYEAVKAKTYAWPTADGK